MPLVPKCLFSCLVSRCVTKREFASSSLAHELKVLLARSLVRLATIQFKEVRTLAQSLSPVRGQSKLVHERTGEILRAAASLTKLRKVQRDLSTQHEPKVDALEQPECYPDLFFFQAARQNGTGAKSSA